MSGFKIVVLTRLKFYLFKYVSTLYKGGKEGSFFFLIGIDIRGTKMVNQEVLNFGEENHSYHSVHQ